MTDSILSHINGLREDIRGLRQDLREDVQLLHDRISANGEADEKSRAALAQHEKECVRLGAETRTQLRLVLWMGGAIGSLVLSGVGALCWLAFSSTFGG